MSNIKKKSVIHSGSFLACFNLFCLSLWKDLFGKVVDALHLYNS